MKKVNKQLILGSMVFLTLFIPIFAYGDITVERFIKIGGMSESHEVTKISGIKKRGQSTTKMTGSLGKLVTKMTGEIKSDSITDIGKDAVWSLDHKNKTYTEQKISAGEGMIAKAEDESRDIEEPEKKEEPRVKVIRNEISVKATSEKKNINGYDCTKYILTWLVETENLETKERAKNIMTTELWNAPETNEIKQLQKEENAFYQAYLKKMGLEMSAKEMQKFGLSMMAGMLGDDEKTTEKNMRELQTELSKIKGYSIATSVRWEHLSDTTQKQEAEKAKIGKEEEESKGIDVSEGIGGFMSGLAKKALKEKMKEKQKEKEAEKEKKGNVVFDSYTEIKKITITTIPSTEFEIPTGYKPVKQ